jgi:hypothetical protein
MQVDCPGSENQVERSSDVGGVEELLGLAPCLQASRSAESSLHPWLLHSRRPLRLNVWQEAKPRSKGGRPQAVRRRKLDRRKLCILRNIKDPRRSKNGTDVGPAWTKY